jgi:pre-mRNA-splicing factor 38A
VAVNCWRTPDAGVDALPSLSPSNHTDLQHPGPGLRLIVITQVFRTLDLSRHSTNHRQPLPLSVLLPAAGLLLVSGMETTHAADARGLLDDRGYRGRLIKGQNPALLVDKALRDRITESLYWKEQCFGLNEASLCDRVAEITYIGGTYGGVGKPTPFLCLLFKLLQLVPDKEVILTYLNWSASSQNGEENGAELEDRSNGPAGNQDDNGEAVKADNSTAQEGAFKYLRVLAAFYIRLAWEPKEIYLTLEPLLADYRKIRRRTKDGYALTFVDQFIDDLLVKDRVCGTSLWKLPKRTLLEDQDILEPRESPLGTELDEIDMDDPEDSPAGSRESEGEISDHRSDRTSASNDEG